MDYQTRPARDLYQVSNLTSVAVDELKLKSQIAQVEDDIEQIIGSLRQIESTLSLDCEDRELISQSLVNLNALSKTCRRIKAEDYSVEFKSPAAKKAESSNDS